MESSRRPATRVEFSPEFKREFVEKILFMGMTLDDVADELGIPPEVMRRWTTVVARAEMNAAKAGGPLVPASRVLELEHDIQELKRVVTHQAITIQILERRRLL